MKPPYPQPVSETLMQPIPSSSVIVIHPGSLNLRIGTAADVVPKTVPHCIARKHNKPGTTIHHNERWLLRKENQHADGRLFQKNGLKQAEALLQERPNADGSTRQLTPLKQLQQFNSNAQPEFTDVSSSAQWTDFKSLPDSFVGEEALKLPPNAPYDLRWPYRCGDLHVTSQRGGSVKSLVADLAVLWRSVIETELGISADKLPLYRVILLVPDMHNRRHVTEIVRMLCADLGFEGVIVHQESVCSLFGAGIYQGCVVDVGDQKVSVCCVDEAVSDVNTRVKLNVGGRDVTRCLYSLLNRSSFPYKRCNPDDMLDALLLQQIKHEHCTLESENSMPVTASVQVHVPNTNITKYSVRLGDERILAPMSFFCPDLFGLKGSLLHVHEGHASLPEDGMDDEYLLMTQSRQEQTARAIAAKRRKVEPKQEDGEKGDSDATEGGEGDDVATGNDDVEAEVGDELKTELLRYGDVPPLHQIIASSIDRCSSDEVKAKMYSCIVLTGGGLKFAGAGSWISYLLYKQLPPHLRVSIEAIDVIMKIKEAAPEEMAWKGGAVLTCLESGHELWVRAEDFLKHGPRVLREKVAFPW